MKNDVEICKNNFFTNIKLFIIKMIDFDIFLPNIINLDTQMFKNFTIFQLYFLIENFLF